MIKKLSLLVLFIASATTAFSQVDKSKRVSPPAKIETSIRSGATVSVDYSQPAVNGRTLGKEIAPFGQVWRTGANEATVFETNRDLRINGQLLPAGKYSLYTIPGEKEWTVIFNKTWNQWGTVYKEDQDALRIRVKPKKAKNFTERLTFAISEKGKVQFNWANTEVAFSVK